MRRASWVSRSAHSGPWLKGRLVCRDIGGFADLTCQHIVANPQASAPSKRLAYELVQVASLQAGLWDLVCRGIKTDVSSAFNSDVGG